MTSQQVLIVERVGACGEQVRTWELVRRGPMTQINTDERTIHLRFPALYHPAIVMPMLHLPLHRLTISLVLLCLYLYMYGSIPTFVLLDFAGSG